MPSATRVAGPVEPDFLRPWREPITSRLILRNSVGSIVVHILLILFIVSLPDVERTPYAPILTPDFKKAVTLVAPRFYEPTQKAPNKGKVSRELDVRSAYSAPQPQAPRYRAPAPTSWTRNSS